MVRAVESIIRMICMSALLLLCVGIFSMRVEAADKILQIDQNLINQVGNQTQNSSACGCFSMAYCRTILDGRVRYYTEFNNGGTSGYAIWSKANYSERTSTDNQAVFRNIIENIDAGSPVIVYCGYTGRYSSFDHYVAIVGYQNVTNINNLSSANFLMYDSGYTYNRTSAILESFNTSGMDLGLTGGHYRYFTTTDRQIVQYNPEGTLDEVTSPLGYVRIRGWVFDRDAIGSTVPVHAYIDGPAGTGTFFGSGNANLSRPDVNKAYGVGDNHGFDFSVPTKLTGNHTIYLYAINIGSNGAASNQHNPLIGSKTVNIQGDTSDPVITDIKVTDITKSGYKVTCKVSDNVGISKVEFPSWNIERHGGENAKWLQGTVSGNTATCYVKTSSLSSGEVEGNFMTHIYAYDYAGNSSYKAIDKVYVDRTNPDIFDVKVTEKDSLGYMIEFKATDNIKIDKVQCPTWTLNKDSTGNDQDDILKDWDINPLASAEKVSGDTYRFRVNIADHNYEYGEYRTHIYAYDTCGNSVCYGTLNVVNIEKPTDTEQASEEPSNNESLNEKPTDNKNVVDNPINGENKAGTNEDSVKNKSKEQTEVKELETKQKEEVNDKSENTSNTISVSKVKLKSVRNVKKKSIIIRWKQDTNVDGYQISYAKKKNFSGAKKKNISANKDSVTIKKLTKGKMYYVKIRSYVKDDNGNKVYGKWSSVKKVKIKK